MIYLFDPLFGVSLLPYDDREDSRPTLNDMDAQSYLPAELLSLAMLLAGAIGVLMQSP
jgi:hypothetical protein